MLDATGQGTDLERFNAAWDEFGTALRRARSRAWQQNTPLTPAQYYLLSALSHEPELGVGEMAAAAGKMPMPGTGKMPMSGTCDGCGDSSDDMTAACAAFCNSAVEAPVAPSVIDVVLIGILRPSAGPAATGHVTPPEPYPPRPSSLS